MAAFFAAVFLAAGFFAAAFLRSRFFAAAFFLAGFFAAAGLLSSRRFLGRFGLRCRFLGRTARYARDFHLGEKLPVRALAQVVLSALELDDRNLLLLPWRRTLPLTVLPDKRRAADLDIAALSDQENLVKFYRGALVASIFSRRRTSPLAARYCLPPLRKTAYIVFCSKPRVAWITQLTEN